MTPDTAAIRERLEKATEVYWTAPGIMPQSELKLGLVVSKKTLAELIEAATRTERERCAKIAREWFDRMIRAGELPADQMRMVKAITAHIARAIEADHD